MPKYRKKPMIVEAVQWTGKNADECSAFTGQGFKNPEPGMVVGLLVAANRTIVPLPIGQWIIKDQLGFYPCDPSVFADTYELVDTMYESAGTHEDPDAVVRIN